MVNAASPFLFRSNIEKVTCSIPLLPSCPSFFLSLPGLINTSLNSPLPRAQPEDDLPAPPSLFRLPRGCHLFSSFPGREGGRRGRFEGLFFFFFLFFLLAKQRSGKWGRDYSPLPARKENDEKRRRAEAGLWSLSPSATRGLDR